MRNPRLAALLTATVSAALAAAPAAADGDLDVPDFDAIRTPDSPAFTVLGVSPSQIERPNTPKQLAIALSGFLSGTGFAIPRNVAVEFAPYWLVGHPDLQLSDYRTRGLGRQLAENITVSLATTSTDVTTADPMASEIIASDTAIAFGVRTTAQLSRDMPACTEDVDALVRYAQSGAITTHPDFAAIAALPQDQREAATDALKARVVAQLADLTRKCGVEGGADARGWSLEAAAATSLSFAESDPDRGSLRSSGAWLTLAYKWIGVSAIGLARAHVDHVADGRVVTFDPGARLVVARGRYALSGELVGRFQVAETMSTRSRDSTYRVALGFDMRLTDQTWLTVSFGKDYSGDEDGKLFSLANLEWGFGDPKITAPK